MPMEKRGGKDGSDGNVSNKENKQQQPAKDPAEKSEKQLKREAKKADKKTKKDQHKSGNAVGIEMNEDAESGPDISEGRYGVNKMNQSREKLNRTLVDIGSLTASMADKEVWVRARLHTSRAKGEPITIY